MNGSAPQVKEIRALPGLWTLAPRHRGVIAGVVLLAAALGLPYYSTFTWLVHAWWTSKEYSHGFLVPAVCLLLVWMRRYHLASLPPCPRPVPGALILLTAGGLLMAARAGGFGLAGAISLTLVLPGLVLFVWGWDHLKALALPLAYLQFMVPWLDVFTDRIYWPFQILTAHIGASTLQVLGYAVLRKAHYLVLPAITVEVVPGCSGINFLTAVIAVGVLLVYLTQRTWLRGTAVIAAGAVIAIAANWARVTIAAMLGYHHGASALHGPFHIFQGWFVAQVGILAMFFVNWRVSKLPSPHGLLYERPVRVPWHEPSTLSWVPAGARLVFAAVLLFAAAVYIFIATPRFSRPVLALRDFPLLVEGWSGGGSVWIKGASFFPGVDDELARTYRAGPQRMVHLYIGYFGIQQQGKSLITFRGRLLHEGASQVRLEDVSDGSRSVNMSQVRIDGIRYEILFWYRYPGRDIPNRYPAKLTAILDGVTRWRNNAAVIILAVPVPSLNGNAAGADLLEFARLIAPLVRQYVL